VSEDALLALAHDVGVAVDWIDFDGQARRVGQETIAAVLTALGHDASAPRQAQKRRRALDAPSFIVAQAGATVTLPSKPRHARVAFEDGRLIDLHAGDDTLAFALTEPGYHTLELDDRLVTLAICPPRCLTPRDLLGRRAWGLGAQLYATREQGAFGDFAGLERLAKAAAAVGADALAISPTNALFPAAPERCSPYSPSSRDHLNILYADPSTLGAAPDPLGGPDLIDWPSASAAKLAGLDAAFRAFAGDPRFDDFVAAGGVELRRHALFETLDEHFAPTLGSGRWRAWPTVFRDPAGAEPAAAALGLGERTRFFLFAQWLADLGLQSAQDGAKAAGMGLGLITDLAVGLDPGGSHAWRRPQDLMVGLTLGAPPDAFQAAGQGWGITSFSPRALKASGYAPFLTTLRAALRHAGGLRIDHALGLGRLWVVPDGAPADQGAYLRYPIDELLSLIALESRRAGAVVIGEDLGVVPEGLRDSLAERGLLGMRVLPFERDAEGTFSPPAEWDPLAVAMTSTHDLSPVAGWWRGGDIAWRERLAAPGDRRAERTTREREREAFWDAARQAGVAEGALPGEDDAQVAVDTALALVAQTPCELAMIPLEDLLGLEDAPNLPGVVEVHPNWRRRLPAGAEALFSQPLVAARLTRLNAQRPR
jgi:4-alpha-glucanotransferase